jgi:hypothetical protein
VDHLGIPSLIFVTLDTTIAAASGPATSLNTHLPSTLDVDGLANCAQQIVEFGRRLELDDVRAADRDCLADFRIPAGMRRLGGDGELAKVVQRHLALGNRL